jgi:threonine aldolase
LLAHRTAQTIHFEGGGPAALAGGNVGALDGPRGQFAAAAAGIHFESRYSPRTRLLRVEQTPNLGGSSIWPLEGIRESTDVARRRGPRTHMHSVKW